jgi:hypothetical protein
MGGDFDIGNKSKILADLPRCLIFYLRDLVGLTAFFPSDDFLHPLFFSFPLACGVSLLLTSSGLWGH